MANHPRILSCNNFVFLLLLTGNPPEGSTDSVNRRELETSGAKNGLARGWTIVIPPASLRSAAGGVPGTRRWPGVERRGMSVDRNCSSTMNAWAGRTLNNVVKIAAVAYVDIQNEFHCAVAYVTNIIEHYAADILFCHESALMSISIIKAHIDDKCTTETQGVWFYWQ